MKLKKWVQGLLLFIHGISFILIMCIEVNLLACLAGMILYLLTMFLLSEYGTILDIFKC